MPRSLRMLVPLLAALLGAFLYHRYSILTLLDRVQADPGDSRFIAFLLEHWNNALHGTADWRSPPIFWPVQGTLAYSDGLLAMGLVHAALRSFLGVFSAMNAQLILLSLGTFAAGYALLARGFRLSVWGATFGAYFIAFGWPRYAQLVHVQLQFTVLLPILALLALECVRDGRQLGRAAFAWRICLFVALLAVLLATTLYYAVFLALWLSVAMVLLLLLSGRGRRHVVAVVRRHAAGLAAGAGLAVMMVGPVVAFYLPLMRESRGRTWSEVATFLPHWLDFVWMGRDDWVWGWLFARWPIAIIHARWPEMRIGVGLAASVAWVAGVAWAVWILGSRRRADRRLGPIALAIVSAAVVQALMLHLPGDRAGWWLVWRWFPGAGGIRGVSRLEVVLMMGMGLWLGFVLDAALGVGRSRPAVAAGALVLAALVAVEQFGGSRGYSGREAEALSRLVARAMPPSCQAAFVMATPDLMNMPVDQAHFDAQAYLAANPDVAAHWKGSAWEHYRRYGQAEHRLLDPSQGWRHESRMYFGYNYTVPLAAALAHRPVVNGLSGWQPPGWNLFDVLSPRAPERLAAWLREEGKPPDSVCTVPVRITLYMVPGLMVPDRAAALWPPSPSPPPSPGGRG